jgi:hypothetical protein
MDDRERIIYIEMSDGYNVAAGVVEDPVFYPPEDSGVWDSDPIGRSEPFLYKQPCPKPLIVTGIKPLFYGAFKRMALPFINEEKSQKVIIETTKGGLYEFSAYVVILSIYLNSFDVLLITSIGRK